MNKWLYSAALIGVLFFAAVWWMDPVSLKLLWLVVIPWICVPAAVIGAVLLFAATLTGRSRLPGLTLLVLVCGVAALLTLVVPVNRFVTELAVSDAKEYPILVEPALESYREIHGSYPTSLDQLSSRPPLPRLMRRYRSIAGKSAPYSSDGRRYLFVFVDPTDPIDPWYYHSEMPTWSQQGRR